MTKRILLAGVLALAVTADANAGWRSRTRTVAVATASGPTTVEQKAQAQAASGRMAHLGSPPVDVLEGVGYSSSSPQAALDACCYSRSGLPLLSQAVARGRNGWYAVRHFAATSTRAVVSAPVAVLRTLTGRGGQTCSGPNCSK